MRHGWEFEWMSEARGRREAEQGSVLRGREDHDTELCGQVADVLD